MSDLPEQQYEWLARPGHVRLLDGERVYVEPGDTLTGYEDPWGAVCFTDLTKRTLHG